MEIEEIKVEIKEEPNSPPHSNDFLKCPEYPQAPLEHIIKSGENLIKSGEFLIGKVQESTIRTTPKGKPKKEFICVSEGCGKKYSKASHLRDHSRVHTGERPFLCSWLGCNRSFTRSDELQRHFRTHTGERNYPCVKCFKKFSRSDHLKKHLNSHIRFERICKKMPASTEKDMNILIPSVEIKEEPEFNVNS
ncbi:sptf-3 family protein [Megaselia abdita]